MPPKNGNQSMSNLQLPSLSFKSLDNRLPALTITSNRQPRELTNWENLPEKERENFDYLESEYDRTSNRLFKYRGSWYDYYEFSLAPDSYRALGWDGVQPQSAWDAIVVTYWTKEGEELDDEIIVGHAHWYTAPFDFGGQSGSES